MSVGALVARALGKNQQKLMKQVEELEQRVKRIEETLETLLKER